MEHVWLSPLGPKLKAGVEDGEAVSSDPHGGRLGPTAPGAVVWLPGLGAAGGRSQVVVSLCMSLSSAKGKRSLQLHIYTTTSRTPGTARNAGIER